MTRRIPDFATANRDITEHLEVFIDGVQCHDVVSYCLTEGWLERYVRGADNKYILAGDRCETETIPLIDHEVVVRWKKAAA